MELQPPYALITAGESLHWMDWGVVLPRFAQLLTQHGVLAIVTTEEQPVPWREGYLQIVRRFSTNPNYQPVDLIAELEQYQLFQKQGERVTAPVPLRQTMADYTAAQHARSTLSLDTMSAEQAAQFGAEMAALLTPFAQDDLLTVQVTGRITWGRPLARKSEGEAIYLPGGLPRPTRSGGGNGTGSAAHLGQLWDQSLGRRPS